MNDLRQTLRKVFLKESDDSGLFQMISSELRDNARRMGINYDESVIVNTNRTLNSVNDIKDVTDGKVQWGGFGSSWLDWIGYNMPQWLSKNFYVLDVDETNMVTIKSQTILKAFEKFYVKNVNLPKDAAIDWQKMYKKGKQGVVFKPYNRGWAEPGNWYRSVDMDSIAITDKKAIRSVKLLLDASELIADYKSREEF